MKKILSVALAVVMCFAMFTVSFAVTLTDDNNTDNSIVIKTSTTKDGETEPAENYEIFIPAENVIPWETDVYALEYTIVKAQLLYNHRLQVAVTANDGTYAGNMTFAEVTETIPYTLPETAFVTEKAMVTNETASVDVTIGTEIWKTVPIAEYSDTLTFTATIVDA